MSDFFDFLEEKEEECIYDLVLVIHNPELEQWIDVLKFMKLNVLIITRNPKYEGVPDIVVSKTNMTSDKFWVYVYNTYKSFNYGIIGEKDNPENFSLMYLNFMNSGVHISINNNPELLNDFNAKFNEINDNFDVVASNYMLFKSNYLKAVLEENNGMDFKHRLVYFKNHYRENIKSNVVEFLGLCSKESREDRDRLMHIKFRKFRILPFAALIVAFEILLVMINDADFFVKCNSLILPIFVAYNIVDVFVKEVY